MGLGAGLGSNARLTVCRMGDSITAGYGSTPGAATKGTGVGYPLFQLAAAAGIGIQYLGGQNLPGADADVRQKYHEGVSGATILSITANMNLRFGYHPEVVLLMAGTNDAMVLANVNTMISQLNTAILTAWNLGQRPGVNYTKLVEVAQIPDVNGAQNIHDLVVAYNALIPGTVATHVAAGRNIKVVDCYTPLGANPGPSFNGASQPHPNDVGYALIAKAWFGTPGSGLLCDYTR